MEQNALIKVDLKESLSHLGIPFMEFHKGDRTLRFLLDTGASMNFIKKEILEEYSADAEMLPYKSEIKGKGSYTIWQYTETATVRGILSQWICVGSIPSIRYSVSSEEKINNF